jgi:hypothetical protein
VRASALSRPWRSLWLSSGVINLNSRSYGFGSLLYSRSLVFLRDANLGGWYFGLELDIASRGFLQPFMLVSPPSASMACADLRFDLNFFLAGSISDLRKDEGLAVRDKRERVDICHLHLVG